MRIGVDVREWEPGKMTGIGRYLLNFLLYAANERPGYRFFLYGNQRTRFPELPSNVEPHALNERVRPWWDQVVIPRRLGCDRIDVFLSPYPKGPVMAPCPYFTTVHDLLFLRLAHYRRPLYDCFYRLSSRVYSRRAHRIVTDSLHSRGDLIDLLGLEHYRIEVVPIGVSPRFRPERDRERLQMTRRRYGLPVRYLLYVGNFKPHKNLERLLEAFELLGRRHPRQRVGLAIAGHDEENRAALVRTTARLGLSDSVVFTGLVADRDLPAVYSGAQAFVTVSLYEGFGLPALEAMACGTPVVASQVTSLPEVVGRAGLLVDPEDPREIADTLARVLDDKRLRNRCRRLGLERAAEFRLEKTSARLLSLLENAVEGGQAAG